MAMLVVLAATVLLSFLLTALVSWAIAAGTSATVDWPGAGQLVRGFGGGLLIAATWGSLGMLLGTALRSTALPIGLGLVWVLAVENLIVNVAAALAGPDATLRTPGVAATVGGSQAAWVLVGFLVVFTTLTGLLLTRRDV